MVPCSGVSQAGLMGDTVNGILKEENECILCL